MIKATFYLSTFLSVALTSAIANAASGQQSMTSQDNRSPIQRVTATSTGIPPLPEILRDNEGQEGVFVPIYMRPDRSGWDVIGRVFTAQYYLAKTPPKEGETEYCRHYDQACVIDIDSEIYQKLWHTYLPVAITNLQYRLKANEESIAFNSLIMGEDAQHQYWFQYTAIRTLAGEEKIEVLGLCQRQFSWDELNNPTEVMDGGDCVLSGVLDLKTGTFDWFNINGRA